MVHVPDRYLLHLCLGKHVSVSICLICNGNPHYTSYNATVQCLYAHGSNVHTLYFCRKILCDKHYKNIQGLPLNNFSSCVFPVHQALYRNKDIFHNKISQDLEVFRWFKFTLKPPYSIAYGKLRLAIWDTSF